MSNLPNRITVLECGPRDGLQIEKVVVSVDDKVRLVNDLVDAGVNDIEVGSYVNPQAVPQMATSSEVVARLEPRDGVRYRVLALGKVGMEQVLQDSKLFKEGMLFTATSDVFLKRNLGKTIDETYDEMHKFVQIYRNHNVDADVFGVMAAFGCNLTGDVPVDRVVDLIARGETIMKDYGYQMKMLRLADTMGWASPLQIKRVLGAVQDRWPETEILLHLHDTRGTGIANIVAAIEMGIIHHESSIGGLGGCPFAGHSGSAGNVSTEDLVFMAQEMGIETGLDLDRLIEVARWMETVVQRQLPGKVMRAGSLSRFRSHPQAA